MFSATQIQYMVHALGLRYRFAELSALTESDWLDIEYAVVDRLCHFGHDKRNRLNADGAMCTSILEEIRRHGGRTPKP